MFPTKLDFEMTLELKEILEREASMLIRLSMKSNTKLNNLLMVHYPGMKLPDYDGKRGGLAWLGVNEDVSKKLLKN